MYMYSDLDNAISFKTRFSEKAHFLVHVEAWISQEKILTLAPCLCGALIIIDIENTQKHKNTRRNTQNTL